MTLSSILNSPPKIHNWIQGQLTSSGLPTEVFGFMDKVLTPESQTLETGMGISTAVFALKGSKHTCVNPDLGEIKRFEEYAAENHLCTGNISFLCKPSHDAWFDLKEEVCDLILIDGLHGFPTPFMDWYFLSQGLSVNGYLIIDDTHIFTGKILKDFLLKEDSWEMIASYYNKTVIFKKVKAFDYNKEFMQQPYVFEMTKALNRKSLPASLFKSIKRKFKQLLS